MRWLDALGTLLLIGLAGFLLFYAQNVTQWLIKPTQSKTPAVALIHSLEGSIKVRSKGEVKFRRVRKGETLHNLDELVVNRDSNVTLGLLPDLKEDMRPLITFTKETLVVFELWDEASTTSPLYLNLFRGDYKVKNPGSDAQRVYVSREGRLLPLGSSPAPFSAILSIRAPTQPAASESSTLPEAPPPGSSSVNPVSPQSQPPEDSTTLSTAYLEELISQQKSNFYRCQANSVRLNKTVTGKMLLQLKIIEKGKVEEVNFLQSSIDDTEFKSCIDSVFRRMKVRPFRGEPILFNVPLEFQ